MFQTTVHLLQHNHIMKRSVYLYYFLTFLSGTGGTDEDQNKANQENKN